MGAPKLVILDLDGTLLDTAHDIRVAINLTLAEFGRAPLALERVRVIIGDGAEALVDRAFGSSSLSGSERRAAVASFLRYYEAPPVHTKLFPHATLVLERLTSRGIRLALCTNKPERATRVLLEAFHLARYFDFVLAGDSMPYRKPDARMITEILHRMNVHVSDAVFVGDSEVDASTAQAAGITFFLMTFGYLRTSREALSTHRALDSLRDLLMLWPEAPVTDPGLVPRAASRG